MPEDAIQELLVVENPRAIRLAFSEKPGVILKQITDRELSISEIARALDLNPGSVHYYLKDLEKQGLVRQVRQEIKGGVVKKYYRAVAKRIVLAGPEFEDPLHRQPISEDLASEELVKVFEHMGYYVSAESREDARKLLLRYDQLLRETVKGLQSGVLDKAGSGLPAVNPSYQLVIHATVVEDPEFDEIYGQFRKLFKRV
ncbi:ArsR/SmtB family transcription factor [Methanocella sp. MCL-LM]|uniref:ArsR/SmtB family transcription factor n=1 Tax=Methanocella sp. MCL-LM TaxID=3412035 RepID=UPI003C794DFC